MALFGKRTTAVGGKVPAVALVCDTYLAFDGDKALRGWATGVLRSKWPGVEVDRHAQVETVMGFDGGDDEAREQLESLLSQAMATAGADRAHYEVTFFTTRSEVPPSKVWCMAAVKP